MTKHEQVSYLEQSFSSGEVFLLASFRVDRILKIVFVSQILKLY